MLNRGYSGYNTLWAKKLLPTVFPKGSDHVTFVTIFFGANDSAMPEEHRQHVPLAEYSSNLEQIVQFVKASCPKAYIILISPPRVEETKWLKKMQMRNPNAILDRTDANAGRYANAAGQLANKVGCGFVNFHGAMQKEENWGRFLDDGLHLSILGASFLAKQILQHIEAQCPRLHVTCDKLTLCPANSGSKAELYHHAAWHDQLEKSGKGVIEESSGSAWFQNGVAHGVVEKSLQDATSTIDNSTVESATVSSAVATTVLKTSVPGPVIFMIGVTFGLLAGKQFGFTKPCLTLTLNSICEFLHLYYCKKPQPCEQC